MINKSLIHLVKNKSHVIKLFLSQLLIYNCIFTIKTFDRQHFLVLFLRILKTTCNQIEDIFLHNNNYLK
jgi:hypothetical protein